MCCVFRPAGSANTGGDAGPSRRQRVVKQEAAVAVKQEGSEGAPGPVDNTLAQSAADMRRAADILSTTLPQVVSALNTLARSTADIRRDAETTSTGLAAVLTEMKNQLTTVASAQLQTVAALTDLTTRLEGMDRSIAALGAKADNTFTAIQANTASVEASNTAAKLQRGVANASIGAFTYYNGRRQCTSEGVVQSVLASFIKGTWRRLATASYIAEEPTQHPTPAQQEAYVNRLQRHIYELTGINPRAELRVEGGVNVWGLHLPAEE